MSVFYQYLYWHFWEQSPLILRIWKSYLLFNLRYWSVPLLAKTLFSYWHKYRYSYGRGFDLQRYFEAFTFNLISRVLGAIMRLILISIGIIVEVFVFLGGLLVFLIWLVLPLVLIFCFGLGLKLLI